MRIPPRRALIVCLQTLMLVTTFSRCCQHPFLTKAVCGSQRKPSRAGHERLASQHLALAGLPSRLRVTLAAILPVARLRRQYVHMSSQNDLAQHFVENGWLKHPHCIEAFRKVDRKNYIADDVPTTLAYLDRPLPNGPYETISAPHMHVTALELLGEKLQPGARVLDVGSGSGFLTACFAYACGANCFVLGLEKHQELAESSIVNIRKADGELLEADRVKIRYGNALADIETQGEKFDAIHVGAAAATLPKNLCKLLNPGGLMVVPVGEQGDTQILTLVRRSKDQDEEKFEFKDIMHVQYVPLTPPE